MDKKFTSALERMDQLLKPHRVWQEQIDKLLEPQRQIQEQMEKYLEPQRRLQEQMNKYLEPHRKLQEQMEKYLEPQRRLREQMNKYLEPHRKLQEQMEKYLEPQRRLREQMNKYLEPHRKLHEQMEKSLEPQRRLREQMNKYLEPHRKLHKQMEKSLEPQRRLRDQISRYLKPLNEYLSSPLMGDIVVGSGGVISVSNEVIDAKELSESIENISNDYSSTEEFLEHFFKLLEKLSNGARIVVIYLVLPYFLAIIANLTTPIYEEWWKEYAELDQRSAKKEIIREANELYNPEELNVFRFVYVSILHVRKSGSINSEIIGELHLGKSVKVYEKSKRWSFIEYQDSESGNIKKGWVFSRYLHKFIK